MDLEKLTAAPAKLNTEPKKLEIHLLVPMGEKDIRSLQQPYTERLRTCGKDAECIVHPWIASGPANRQDLWRLFDRVCDKNREEIYTVFLFAGWHGWLKNTDVGLMQWDYAWSNLTRRIPIEQAAEVWDVVHHKCQPYYQIEYFRNFDDSAFDLVLDTHAKFFYDPCSFVSLTTYALTAPVFFLTKHVTSEENATIKDELYKPGSEDDHFIAGKDYPFVEWPSEKDGTEHDMWRLLWQCETYRGHGSTGTAIFVDKQTVSDKLIIVGQIV